MIMSDVGRITRHTEGAWAMCYDKVGLKVSYYGVLERAGTKDVYKCSVGTHMEPIFMRPAFIF